ncbi:MAG TPA: GNAT family N-acetyltransferase [Ktedonobacterales bacterium]|jgi:GNAT superfamily N-acetyltransferase|nr:GNAT family N-acetyltransferase [Ktedonobacterales bacterium]
MRDSNEADHAIRYDISIDDAPSEADVRFIEEQLISYNLTSTGYADYRPLAVFARADDGTIRAGLTGFTWGGALKIEYLWVHEDLRGQGYGSRLMLAAEQEALRRDCHLAVVDTHSFQGPNFYPKLGYVQCGLVEGWPAGHTESIFRKILN